jgi:predicted ATPase
VRVEIRNIGPVNHAAIDLDGLTVLVGPNGSGKTTVSSVSYAALRSYEFALMLTNQMLLSVFFEPERRTLSSNELSEQFAIAFRDHLSSELERCISVDLAKLPRRGRTGNGSAPRIIVSDDNDLRFKLVFRMDTRGRLALENKHGEYLTPTFEHLVADTKEVLPTDLWTRFRRNGHTVTPIYFPAARSGYVQMQSIVSSLLLAALGRGRLSELSVGKISGIATDFLEFLASIDPNEKSELDFSMAERVEDELLHGQVRLRAPSESSRVMEFAPEGLNEYWPMDAAATSVGELTPLILYLRHRARRSDFLFIDEPEAHLHPENQVGFADILLTISSHIRGMVVGTHSDFFVTGVSNGLLRSRLGRPSGSGVALYQLERARSTGGYTACPHEVDIRAGFTVEQFTDVAEQTVDEAQRLFEMAQSATQ